MLDKYSVTCANMALEYISKVSKSCLCLSTLYMRVSSASNISKISNKKIEIQIVIAIFGFCIKCIQMYPNKPSISPVVLGIYQWNLKKFCSISNFPQKN